MKLGIVVVYMVKPENAELLDLHLNKIRTLTTVPYTIYAGVNRPPPSLLERLKVEAGLEIVPLPETDLSSSAEHSFYLEHLIERALNGDVTHVVTLHVDSFPIRHDWAEVIAAQLKGNTALATLSKNRFLIGYSACLFFRRDFWEECRPRLLLTAADRSSQEYERFARDYRYHDEESGAGYLFRAYASGKEFMLLERSNAGEDVGQFGSVHGDLVFHLEGAYRYDKLSEEERATANKARRKALIVAKNRLKRCVPKAVRRRARGLSLPLINSWERPLYDEARRALLDDPEGYLERLRAGAGRAG